MTLLQLEPDAGKPAVFIDDGTPKVGRLFEHHYTPGVWMTAFDMPMPELQERLRRQLAQYTHYTLSDCHVQRALFSVHRTWSHAVYEYKNKPPRELKPGEAQQWIPVANKASCLPTKDAEFHKKRARARATAKARKTSRKKNR